jgi:tetratricopeptide (TPR) repeat protein
MRLRFLALLAPLLVAAAPASAGNSSIQALKEARKLTGEATVEYNVGRFEQALDLYTKAYERYPKPALLFDLGQCHRQLGHYERALFFLHGYLREQPTAPNRALVEKLIDDSQQQLDAQRATEAAEAAQAAQAQARAAEAARPQSPPSAIPPPATASQSPRSGGTEAPPAPGSSVLPVVGFAMAGVGALLVGGGVYAGLRSASLAKEISQLSTTHGTWTPQIQSDYESGKSFATIANVLYVSGAVALSTGVALAWFGWPTSTPATASLTPLRGGAAVDLVARF